MNVNVRILQVGEKGHVKPATYLDSHEKFLIGVATKGGSIVLFYFDGRGYLFYLDFVMSLIVLTHLSPCGLLLADC